MSGDLLSTDPYYQNSFENNGGKEIVIPEPQDLMCGNVPVRVVYDSLYGGIQAEIRIDLAAAEQLAEMPALLGDPWRVTVSLTTDNGEHTVLVVNTRWLTDLKRAISTYRTNIHKAELRQEAQRQFDAYYARYHELEALGRPVEKLMHELRVVRVKILCLDSMYYPGSYPDLMSALRAAEHEINRINDGGSQLLVDGLIDGSVYHSAVDKNRAVLKAIEAFSIRSGGAFTEDDKFDEAWLWQFYADRVGDVQDTRELKTLDLLIPIDDYVIEDDADLGFAPKVIMLEVAKGPSAHVVSYGYRVIDDQKVAVGSITVSRRLYDTLGADYGKRSGFPVLPHGIQLWLEVTLEDKVIASGIDGEALHTRVERHRKGAQRGAKLTREERNRHRDEVTGIPYWAKGQASRARR